MQVSEILSTLVAVYGIYCRFSTFKYIFPPGIIAGECICLACAVS
jgi:hypothetical protein